MPEIINDRTIFSLLEVTRSIQKTISDRYRSLFWVKAEMNKLNYYKHSGHCYPELVEKKDGKIVAEIRSILWKADFERINTQFLKLLNEPLRDGITIYFQAGISFDPLYGLSLRIIDIDASFVLGELEKEKKESILRLQQEGLFKKNKETTLPLIPKRLAIISVETSKGLSDFYKIINNNPWGYKVETTLYPALLQGDRSIPSIINQLDTISERTQNYDAVAIIRGGGGEVGLSSYNNYLLAKAIATFPIPVLTGIGHSTNETVSEMVAYKNAITPSELADFLIQKYHNFSVSLDEINKQLIAYTQQRFVKEKQILLDFLTTLRWNGKNEIKTAQHQVQLLQHKLILSSRHLIENQHALVENIEKLTKLSDPLRLLKRGFSISKINGRATNSVGEINLGDEIETQLADGHIISQVIKKV